MQIIICIFFTSVNLLGGKIKKTHSFTMFLFMNLSCYALTSCCIVISQKSTHLRKTRFARWKFQELHLFQSNSSGNSFCIRCSLQCVLYTVLFFASFHHIFPQSFFRHYSEIINFSLMLLTLTFVASTCCLCRLYFFSLIERVFPYLNKKRRFYLSFLFFFFSQSRGNFNFFLSHYFPYNITIRFFPKEIRCRSTDYQEKKHSYHGIIRSILVLALHFDDYE